jgi:hypothetical protein
LILSLSLSSIANRLPHGRVRWTKVDFCGYLATGHRTPWKRKRPDITVWINGYDGDRPILGVHCRRREYDPLQVKDWIYGQLGLTWKPKRRKPAPVPPFAITNQFFGETLKVCRYRAALGVQITREHFLLLVNDLRPTNDQRREWAGLYAWEFDIGPDVLKEALAARHRTYEADERARILGVTYAERQHLGLRRTGSIDLDKEARERARRDRYNAKRRTKRAQKRVISSRVSISTQHSGR